MNRIRLWVLLLFSLVVLSSCIIISYNSLEHGQISNEIKYSSVQNLSKPDNPSSLYLVTVDRLTINDLLNDRDLYSLISKFGAIGMMSTGVEGTVSPDSSFASIGAGAPLNASGSGHQGINASNNYEGLNAGKIYRQRTGYETEPKSVLQLDIARIIKLNENNRFSGTPGYLGSLLAENNIDVRVFGNSDISGQNHRPSVALGMDEQGLIPEGNVGQDLILEDINFPGGLRTDYNNLEKLLNDYVNAPGLNIIELGDLSRVEETGYYITKEINQNNRELSKARINTFIIDLISKINLDRDMIMLVSPTPRGNYLPDPNYLTPVVILGKGVTAGILTSPTTKRPGIIRNTDIAPTILNYFGIENKARMYGRELQVIPTNDAGPALSSQYAKLKLTFESRSPILRNYVLIQLILVILSLAVIFMPQKNFLMALMKPLLLAVMTVPLALLLVAKMPQSSTWIIVFEIISITTAAVSILHLWLDKYSNGLDPFIIISLLTSLCILIDLLLGAPMQKNSLLGYDPIVGARFYGLGNEYMGILIGATIVGTTAFVSRVKNINVVSLTIIGIYYFITLYIIAAPQLGTNVGGSITAAFSFLVTILLLAGVKFNFRTLLKITASVSILLIALLAYDISRPIENQSHIGRTANLIFNGGPKEIIQIINRKLAMNIKLIRYTIWSRIFLASLASLAILFYRPIGIMQSIRSDYPEMFKGFIGVVTASFVALIFNDSGIVAAATTMIFGAPPLLYLVIRTLRINNS